MNQVFSDNQMEQNQQGQQPVQMRQNPQGQQSVQMGQNSQGQQSAQMRQNPQGQQPAQMGPNFQGQRQMEQAPQRPQFQNQNQENRTETANQIKDKNGAGFWVRLAAYTIDYLIVGACLLVVNVPLWIAQLSVGNQGIFKNILFSFNMVDIINYILISAYFIVMTYTSGRTIGKMLMKIRVKSEVSEKMTFGQVAFREIVGKYLSGILYIGYIMIGISDKKKGLHDMLADTKVVYEVNQ